MNDEATPPRQETRIVITGDDLNEEGTPPPPTKLSTPPRFANPPVAPLPPALRKEPGGPPPLPSSHPNMSPAPYGGGSQAPWASGVPGAGPGPAVFTPTATNGLAIASLVVGVLWLYWLGSILALVFGYIALSQIRRKNESGRGLAIAGIVLGWVGVGVLVVILILLAVATSQAPNS